MKAISSILILLLFASCTKFGKNHTVKGRVLNPITGEGIPGAEIKLQKTTAGLPGGYKTVKSTTTDANGYFEISKASLSKLDIVCHTTLYEIGWHENGEPLKGQYRTSVKKGKVMHLDYYAVPYGELKISIHNVNCQGPTDTLIYERDYVSFEGITIFQPFIFTGCYDNDGAFASVPCGDYSVKWKVIRNGVENSYNHTLTVTEGSQVSYNIDY